MFPLCFFIRDVYVTFSFVVPFRGLLYGFRLSVRVFSVIKRRIGMVFTSGPTRVVSYSNTIIRNYVNFFYLKGITVSYSMFFYRLFRTKGVYVRRFVGLVGAVQLVSSVFRRVLRCIRHVITYHSDFWF